MRQLEWIRWAAPALNGASHRKQVGLMIVNLWIPVTHLLIRVQSLQNLIIQPKVCSSHSITLSWTLNIRSRPTPTRTPIQEVVQIPPSLHDPPPWRCPQV